MRTPTWIPAGLSLFLIGSCLAAPETPAPDPAGPAAGDGGVTLAYKFKAGQLQRFRTKVKSSMTLTQEGSGGGLGPIPIELLGHVDTSEKVMGTREGTGTLAVAVDAMNVTVNVLGMPFELKVQNGKVVVHRNGQGADMGPAPGGLEALAAGMPVKPVTVRRSAAGVDTAVGAVATSPAAALLGGSGPSLQLPPNPVKVGDAWETTAQVHQQGVGLAAGSGELQMRLTNTLKSLETKAGHQIAVIETIGTTSASSAPAAPPSAPADGAAPPPGTPPPPAQPASASQEITATTRFDVTRGAVVSSEATIDVTTNASVPQVGATGGAAAGGPMGMRVDANIKLSIAELTAAPAAKKAATRRPVRRAKKR